jgi:haloalkane dehalogenase
MPGGVPVGDFFMSTVLPLHDFLRTQETAFSALPGYDFAPHYIDSLRGFEGIRVHYVDELNSDDVDTVFLCLHGNPAWSYLYRHMIPVFKTAGRIVAPDLIGFGRSDKPANESWHTFDRHRDVLLAFIEALNLKNITLVVQDWGGIFGLTLPMAMPERFTRLVVMNTAFAVGELPSEGFRQWRAFSNSQHDLDLGKLQKRGKPSLTNAEIAAYNAPYPDASYKAAIRAFPNLVPETPDAPGAAISRAARTWFANEWRGKTFAAIGARDPVLGPEVMRDVLSHIRDCPEPLVIAEAGHFVQEWGEHIARAALAHFSESH